MNERMNECTRAVHVSVSARNFGHRVRRLRPSAVTTPSPCGTLINQVSVLESMENCTGHARLGCSAKDGHISYPVTLEIRLFCRDECVDSPILRPNPRDWPAVFGAPIGRRRHSWSN